MDVEVLVVPGCPSERPAIGLVRGIVDELGLSGVEVRTTVMGSSDQAAERRFDGSPTFLIDGVDPFQEAGREPGLSCRVYRTDAGLAGLPFLSELRRAFVSAAAATPDAQP